MKSITNFSLFISLLFLLTAFLGAVHGDGDNMGSGHLDSSNMMNTSHEGFEGYSEHMKITGNVEITDSVKLSISAEPTDEMNEMMEDHMGSQSNMMSYTNMMTISMTKLVEFEDLTSDGYSDDDVQISEFVMNVSTMNPVELQTNAGVSTFVISSKSTVINITVEILSENNNPYAFKWSLDIDYPFAKNNTSVAILHEMASTHMDDLEQNMGHMEDQGFDSNMMTDNDEHLPMLFSWDEQYTVDGETREVLPNLENNIFSLSFVQGEEILYDPRIGFDPVDIKSVDGILGNLSTEQFWETVKTPTSLGIILGILAVGILFTSSRLINSTKK